MFFSRKKSQMPDQAEALPGREAAMPVPARHAVKDVPLVPPFPDGLETLAEAGVKAIVHPGGSMRDDIVTEAAEAASVTLYLTGARHFAH